MINSVTYFLDKIVGNYKGGFVIAYHQISENRFIEHQQLFEKLEAIPLIELLKRNKNGLNTKGLYSITIDDAYENTIEPLTQNLKVPITIFVQTDYIKGIIPDFVKFYIYQDLSNLDIVKNEYFNKFSIAIDNFFSELKLILYSQKTSQFNKFCEHYADFLKTNNFISDESMKNFLPSIGPLLISKLSKNELISFESHGKSHQPVSALTKDELSHELKSSINEILQLTGKVSKIFCYPYGQQISIGNIAPELVSLLFEFAVTMNPGRIKSSNPYLIPRIPFFEKDYKLRALAKISTLFYKQNGY
ncbi:MAG: polysaccharide deacetylase family protein [Bacteroidetes bacterium]|nr:polysaccharide deacetylase family protein [Bacteroidota bacterium]